MLKDHPVIKNIAVVISFLSIIGGSTGIMWNIYAESERSADQTSRLMAIQKEQVAIRTELALQTADLEEIRKTQGNILHHFDEVKQGQRRIIDKVQDGLLGMSTELGRVSERTKNLK